MTILLFVTFEAAQAALSDLESRAMDLWEQAGYEVNRQQRIVYGKNAATGETVYEGGTTAWDTIKEHPEGGWYFASPRQQYPDYFASLMLGHAFTEAELPVIESAESL